MKKYLISLCSEYTINCELDLSDEELEFLIKISKKINKCSEDIWEYEQLYCNLTSIEIFEEYKKDEKGNYFSEYKNDLVEGKRLIGNRKE